MWNVTGASCNGPFLWALHGRCLPVFLICFPVSYSAPFSLSQVLFCGIWGRPTAGWTLVWQLGILPRTKLVWIILFFNHISLSCSAVSEENIGVGNMVSHHFVKTILNLSIFMSPFVLLFPFTPQSFPFFFKFLTTVHYEKPWFSLYFTWRYSL